MRGVLEDLALPTFRRFAHRWGYEVHAELLPVDGTGADAAAQGAKWSKITLLRAALRRHALALWVDADVLLLRDDEDVADHLRPGDFQALVLEHVPAERRVNPNTGVWLLRSCPAAFAFLDAVEDAGPQPGPWADQGAVLAALGWHRGDERYHGARPGGPNAYAAATSWLPTGWNQPYVGDRSDGCGGDGAYNSSCDSYASRPVVADPHALHFMGMTPLARRVRMSETVRDHVPAGAPAA